YRLPYSRALADRSIAARDEIIAGHPQQGLAGDLAGQDDAAGGDQTANDTSRAEAHPAEAPPVTAETRAEPGVARIDLSAELAQAGPLPRHAAADAAAQGAVTRMRTPAPSSRFRAAAALLLALAGPAAAKDTGIIFVSNEKTNNLTLIDSKTYKVIKDIKTSRRPRDMHFNADHTRLYVACGDDDVIDVIDVAKLEVVAKLATGPSPETFAIDEARRRIYVANEEGSSLSIIDLDENIIVREVPTGGEPEGVLVSQDGRTVYVTSEVGDIVHRIDADAGIVEDDVVVGTRPRRFAAT